MKNNLSVVFSILIHTLAISKLIYDQTFLFFLLLFYSGLILYFRKELKLLASLEEHDKFTHLIVIQSIFLVNILTTAQTFTQLLSLLGIIVCEVVRLKQIPIEITKKNESKHLSDKIEEMNRHFLTVRAQRHDFLKHVHVLDYLMKKDTNIEAQEYFKELLDNYVEVNGTIQGEEVHISSLLMKGKMTADQLGIDLIYKLDYPISLLPMNKTSQVQLISNLLENAIEAASSYKSRFDQSTVVLETEIHGGIYLLRISNHAYFEDKSHLDTLFEQFGSTAKEGDHQGLGTYIIKNLVDMHRGRLSYQYSNNELAIKIKLPMINATAELHTETTG